MPNVVLPNRVPWELLLFETLACSLETVRSEAEGRVEEETRIDSPDEFARDAPPATRTTWRPDVSTVTFVPPDPVATEQVRLLLEGTPVLVDDDHLNVDVVPFRTRDRESAALVAPGQVQTARE